MNSDPYDSAVWRSFGMLDSDESAIFDEAARIDPLLHGALLEMDRLAAAIALANTTPVEPKAGQLERLQARLGIQKVRRGPWIAAISGWAAAAALALMWVLDHRGLIGTTLSRSATPDSSVSRSSPVKAPTPPAIPGNEPKAPAAGSETPQTTAPPVAAVDDSEIKIRVRAETKRLNQEIEVLRENLEKYQSRDRVLFEPVPGVALPVVMTMSPPGTAPDDPGLLAAADDHSPIPGLLGDSRGILGGNSAAGGAKVEENAVNANTVPPPPADHPTAIPIYDAARDAGTLVVSNLPPAEQGKVYNLWVRTLNADKPVYVGSLPASGGNASGAESFDFTLGTNMALPSGFMLTKDAVDQPTSPNSSNTVLQGPPTPGR